MDVFDKSVELLLFLPIYSNVKTKLEPTSDHLDDDSCFLYSIEYPISKRLKNACWLSLNTI